MEEIDERSPLNTLTWQLSFTALLRYTGIVAYHDTMNELAVQVHRVHGIFTIILNRKSEDSDRLDCNCLKNIYFKNFK